MKKPAERFILLPVRGMVSEAMREIGSAMHASQFKAAATAQLRATGLRRAVPPAVKILHSLHENGAKLVELSSEALAALRVSDPGVRAVPIVTYMPARQPRQAIAVPFRPRQRKLTATAAAKAKPVAIVLTIADAASGRPVAGAQVVAFTNFARQEGLGGTSGAKGTVSLGFGTATRKLELLLVYGPTGYWGLLRRNVTISSGTRLALNPIDLQQPDFLASRIAAMPRDAGKGVKVGVIDTGVDATHPDLTVSGGAAFVFREADAGGAGPAARDGEHGSHVAGIIASRGAPPDGKRGVAPAVTLFSYRVFPNAGGGADNYDIVRAIDRGVADRCDLLNLSLGARTPDPAVQDAIKDAFDRGTVCIVAAGNDGRLPVSFPAGFSVSVAVSAMGDVTTFPVDSTETLDVVPPRSAGFANLFIAAFSNIGPEIDVAGTGVGIVSTVPGSGYAVMSGTSMACPAVAGCAAALLGRAPAILAMARNRARSIAIVGLINKAAKPAGFGPTFEGVGLLP